MSKNTNFRQDTKNKIMNKFKEKLKNSGYSQDQIEDIVTSGLLGYTRKAKRAEDRNQPLHRSGKSTEQDRFKKRYIDKYTWQNKKSTLIKNTKSQIQKKYKKYKSTKTSGLYNCTICTTYYGW